MRAGSVPVVAPSRALSSRQTQIMALIAKPPQQPALAGQLQPARAGQLGKLAQQLLIGRGQLHGLRALTRRHVSHWCLLRLWSYTVETTVPLGEPSAARAAVATVSGRRRAPGR